MRKIFLLLILFSSIVLCQIPTRPVLTAGNGTNEKFLRIGKLAGWLFWDSVDSTYKVYWNGDTLRLGVAFPTPYVANSVLWDSAGTGVFKWANFSKVTSDTSWKAINVMGGGANKLLKQVSTDSTGFVDAPADSNQVLHGNFKWKIPTSGIDTTKISYLAKAESYTGAKTFYGLKFNGTYGYMELPTVAQTTTNRLWTASNEIYYRTTEGGGTDRKVALQHNYYTQANMQTSGQAQLHWGNLTNKVDAVADGATKGIVGFNSSDFESSSGIISFDYTNAQKASGSVPGLLTAADWTTFNTKQAALVSGTNIKTINSTSLLGSGDITVLTSEVDGSTTNEIQTLGTSGNTITLTSGGSVTAPYATNAGNASTVTNGVYTNVANTFTAVSNSFEGYFVVIGKANAFGGGLYFANASNSYTSSISGENTANSSKIFFLPNRPSDTLVVKSQISGFLTSEVDGSTTNEIQTLGTSGNTITLTSGGSVTAPYATNAGNASTVTNGVYTNATNTFAADNTFYGIKFNGTYGYLELPAVSQTTANRLWTASNEIYYRTTEGGGTDRKIAFQNWVTGQNYADLDLANTFTAVSNSFEGYFVVIGKANAFGGGLYFANASNSYTSSISGGVASGSSKIFTLPNLPSDTLVVKGHLNNYALLSGSVFTGDNTFYGAKFNATYGYLDLPTASQTTANRMWSNSNVLYYRTTEGGGTNRAIAFQNWVSGAYAPLSSPSVTSLTVSDGTFTLGTSGSYNGGIVIKKASNNYSGTMIFTSLSDNRTATFPDASGTVITTGNLSSLGGVSGSYNMATSNSGCYRTITITNGLITSVSAESCL